MFNIEFFFQRLLPCVGSGGLYLCREKWLIEKVVEMKTHTSWILTFWGRMAYEATKVPKSFMKSSARFCCCAAILLWRAKKPGFWIMEAQKAAFYFFLKMEKLQQSGERSFL